MMICPQTTVGCYNTPQCQSAESCVMSLCNPPKPSMAEFERLVDALKHAAMANGDDIDDARSALIDWVRNNLRIS
jgi:hypothetical protein